MGRRQTDLALRSSVRDGTSQRERLLPALHPQYVSVEERSTADWLRFVAKLAKQLRFFEAETASGEVVPSGTWEQLVTPPDGALLEDDMVRFIEQPEQFRPEHLQWLSRPHFALLLTCLHLLRHARRGMGQLTERHLDYYYLDILRSQLRPPEADRVMVAFELAPGEEAVRLAAGTQVAAGADSDGNELVYETERDLIVSRAEVAAAKSVRVEREVLTLGLRPKGNATAKPTFEQLLHLAWDIPMPGGQLPPQGTRDSQLSWTHFASESDGSLGQALAELKTHTGLSTDAIRRLAFLAASNMHHEKRETERFVQLLGTFAPTPVDASVEPSAKQVVAALAVLDSPATYATSEGVPGVDGVSNLTQLYVAREQQDAEAFIQLHFGDAKTFANLVSLRGRVASEWRSMHQLLEQLGNALRGGGGWSLSNDQKQLPFEEQLRAALKLSEPAEPHDWLKEGEDPVGRLLELAGRLDLFERASGSGEEKLALGLTGVELETVATLAQGIEALELKGLNSWETLEQLLSKVFQSRQRLQRAVAFWQSVGRRAPPMTAPEREALALHRPILRGEDVAIARKWLLRALESLRPPPTPPTTPEDIEPVRWAVALDNLKELKDLRPAEASLLDSYWAWLSDPAKGRAMALVTPVLTLAEVQRRIDEAPEQAIPKQTTWRNLFAAEDSRKSLSDSAVSSSWKPFGTTHAATGTLPPEPGLGFVVCAPVLALASGHRTVTLAIELEEQGVARWQKQMAESAIAESDRGEWLANGLVVDYTAKSTWATPKQGPVWTLLTESDAASAEVKSTLTLVLGLLPEEPGVVALPPFAQPALRVRLRQQRPKTRWETDYKLLGALQAKKVEISVEVEGLKDVLLQADSRRIDPKQPFEPFGSEPVRGSQLSIVHPELFKPEVRQVQLTWRWASIPPWDKTPLGNPSDAANAVLTTHYNKYGKPYAGDANSKWFQAKSTLVTGGAFHRLEPEKKSLFARPPDQPEGENLPAQPDSSGAPIVQWNLNWPDNALGATGTQRGALARNDDDLRDAGQRLSVELLCDFGHKKFPTLASEYSRKLALDIANQTTAVDPQGKPDYSAYEVPPPYTPTLDALEVWYRAQVTVVGNEASGQGELLHWGPFGVIPIQGEARPLLPRYDNAGELYIGLSNMAGPREVSLLFQVAEGTSDPEVLHSPLQWHYLDGDEWVDLRDSRRDGRLRLDSTDGLLHSGLVELSLPAVKPSRQLSPELVWVRIALAASLEGVCDLLEVRAQATVARLSTKQPAPTHFEQPLAAGTVVGLVHENSGVASVEQPYTSFGGRATEKPEAMRTRVSERLRHKQRALTRWDYERLVLQHFSNVYKVKCLPVTEPFGPLTILVVPDIHQALPADAFAPRAGADLLAQVQAYLSERAPQGANLQVRNPTFVPVQVRLGARFRPGVDAGFAAGQLERDLVRLLSPWAYKEGRELTIGGQVFESSILAFADGLDYVDYVTNVKLFRRLEERWAFSATGVVQTNAPDEVLVSARQHVIDPIVRDGYNPGQFRGINYMKVELDFIVSGESEGQ